MRVLIISGTDHKGSTYNIGRILADKLAAAGTGMKSAVSPEMKKSIDSAMEKIAGKIRSRYGNVPVPLKTRGFFKIMSLIQKKGWNKADVDYWNAKGWTGSKRPWN